MVEYRVLLALDDFSPDPLAWSYIEYECHWVGVVVWGLGTIFDHNINLIMQQNIIVR